MRIVFWENIISQHKVAYWHHLSLSNKVVEFTLVVESALTNSLKKQGWQVDESLLKNINLIINPKEEQIRAVLSKNAKNSYHVFSGIRANPLVFKALKLSLDYSGLHRILLTETINYYGLRSITRRIASIWIERKYLRYFDLVLGSGATTKAWYKECGLDEEKFYDFLYSIDVDETGQPASYNGDQVRFIFVGQLIKRKGLDILIEALSRLEPKNWILSIYGSGEKEEELKNLVKKKCLDENIFFEGVISNKSLKLQMKNHDCLILPSRFDGWGAVVNEAIAAGLQVICSDRCGASILLANNKVGWVFDIKKPFRLTAILEELIQEKASIDRNYILNYNNYLKGDAVADYLIAIMAYHYFQKGERPLPPWECFLLEVES